MESIWNSFNLTGHAELGDLCEGAYFIESSSVYQRVWSNRAAAAGGDPCVPALNEPYYSTTFAEDWYPITAGGTASIPVEGWSTGSVASWGVRTFVKGSVQDFSAGFSEALPTLNAGVTVEMTVSAPATATSGSYAVIMVESLRPAGSRLTDGAHIVPVGVYVP